MMSEEDTVRIRVRVDGSVVRELPNGIEVPHVAEPSDWARVDAMTDEDAEYNALMDPDFEPFLTDEDREKIKTLPDPKRIRKKLKLTQKEFSRRYEIPLGTLRDWERRVRFPDSAARAYLTVISRDPKRIAALLAAPEPAEEPAEELAKAS
jgi:putative transcriptional regulator